MATSVFLAPAPVNVTQLIPGGNVPASGAKLFGYLAGTSTKQAMYVDNTGTTQWSNPIILDSGGNLTGSKEVWIAAGIPMKFVLAPSIDTDPPLSPYWSVDNLSGINDLTQTDSEWIGGPAPTFISATQFSLVGDQTLVFTVNRRVKSTNTAGTIYSTISVSSFGGGITTITVVNDSGILDAGLSAVFYGLIPPTSNSLPRGQYNVTNLIASGTVSSAVVSTNTLNATTSISTPLIQVSAGSVIAPSYGFTGSSTGRFQRAGLTGVITESLAGIDYYELQPNRYILASNVEFSWGNSSTISTIGAFDAGLARNAVGIVEVNTGTKGTMGNLAMSTLTFTGAVTTVGGNIGTLNNSPHTGNPTAWPRITIDGSTMCFPAFPIS